MIPSRDSMAVPMTAPDSYSSALAGTAVSWGAIFAGAAATAALSLILIVLGTGFGLSSISPWAQAGVGAAAFGAGTIFWLMLTQIAASGMGGYIAGRLRTKWASIHADEVHFRDTAHGFLAWAVATCLTAALLTSAIGSVIGSGSRTAAVATGTSNSSPTDDGSGSAIATPAAETRAYFVDLLLRNNALPGSASSSSFAATPESAATATGPSAAETGHRALVAEVTTIFTNAARAGSLPDPDAEYLGILVARQTGLPAADAQTRVRDTYSRLQNKLRDDETAAKAAADTARKAGASAALWLFVSLLIGAFSASLAATYGGRQRDL